MDDEHKKPNSDTKKLEIKSQLNERLNTASFSIEKPPEIKKETQIQITEPIKQQEIPEIISCDISKKILNTYTKKIQPFNEKLFEESQNNNFIHFENILKNLPISQKCPYTSILAKYTQFEPNYSEIIYPKCENPCLKRRHVHKVILNNGQKYALKCIKGKFDDDLTKNKIYREFFIGKTIGSFSKHTAEIKDIMEAKIDENTIVWEILIEYGGVSLEELLQNKVLNCENELFYRILWQAIRILELNEKIGIAHFDVKPLNFVYNQDQQLLKIIDFGTSISFFNSVRDIKAVINYNLLTGYTEIYAPPELKNYKIKPIYPNKVDIYSLGRMILNFLLTFNGFKNEWENHNNNLEDFIEILNEKYKKTHRNFLKWNYLLNGLMHENPNERFEISEIKKIYQEIVKNTEYKSKSDYIFEETFGNIDFLKTAKLYRKIRQKDLAALHYERYLETIEKYNPEELFNIICELIEYLNENPAHEEGFRNIIHIYGRLFGTDFNCYAKLYDEIANFLENGTTVGNDIYFWNIVINVFKNEGEMRKIDLARAYIEIADRLRKNYDLKDLNKALDYCIEAKQITENTQGTNNELYLEIELKIFKIYRSNNDHKTAISSCLALLESAKIIYKEENKFHSEIYTLLAYEYAKLLDRDKSTEFLQKSIELNKKFYGLYNNKNIKLYEKLSNIYHKNCDYENVIKCHLGVLQNLEKLKGEFCYGVKSMYEKLEKIYCEIDQKENAEKCSLKIKEIQHKIQEAKKIQQISVEQKPLEKPKSLYTSYRSLEEAKVFMQMHELKGKGKIDEAILVSTKFIESRNMSEISDQNEIANILNELAKLYKKKNQKDKQIECLLKVAEIRAKTLGENHEEIFETHKRLAVAYFNNEDYQKAIDRLNKSYAILKNCNFDNPFKLSSIYTKLSCCYARIEDHVKAALFCTKASECFESKQENLYDVVKPYDILASEYVLLKNDSTALDICIQGTEIRKKILGENNPEIAESYENLSCAYAQNSQNEKAFEIMKKAFDLRSKMSGSKDPTITISYENLGFQYALLSDYENSVICLKKAFQIKQEILGKTNPLIFSVFDEIYTELAKRKMYDEALYFCSVAMEQRSQIYGENSIEILKSYDDLMKLYAHLGQVEQANLICEMNIEIRKRILTNENISEIYKPYSMLSKIYKNSSHEQECELYEAKLLSLKIPH